ncbi:hypothetical protein KM043_013907 [Ampulex compressa]|nr:hypothetical protein KM043_013907 [Ampulex compressa]
MEGARWDIALGSIMDSKPKELFSLMPVIFIKSIVQEKQDLRNVYDCPVYKTRSRGPTYVWTFNLKTRDNIILRDNLEIQVNETYFMAQNMTSNAGVFLPTTATMIRVINVLDPYTMRIYDTTEHAEKIQGINMRLLKLMQNQHPGDTLVFNVGDLVLVRDISTFDSDLPPWPCRGSICNVNKGAEGYRVLLVDYGICVELTREDLLPLPKFLVPQRYLSFTAGLYNLVPAEPETKLCRKKDEVSSLRILKEWSEFSVEFTKELLASAETIYFDHLITDCRGRKYGEIYLEVDGELTSLSQALIRNKHAVYLEEDLLRALEGPEIRQENEIVYLTRIENENCKKNFVDSEKDTGKSDNPSALSEVVQDEPGAVTFGGHRLQLLISVLDAKFPIEIHKVWESMVRSSKAKRIQSYIWPAMKGGLDVVAAGAPGSGKTFAWTVAICGLLAAKEIKNPWNRPSALVLCSSSVQVLRIRSLLAEFLRSYKSNPAAIINGMTDRSLMATIYNGCQILISTPRFLVRFLERNEGLLGFENLEHLVLDRADVIMDKYSDSVLRLIADQKILQCRRRKHFQVTMVSCHWTSGLRKGISLLTDDPLICVTSYLEAAILRAVRPKLFILDSTKKHQRLLELLQEEDAKLKCMIICTNAVEAEELDEFLKVHKGTLLAHENMDLMILQDIKHRWKASVSEKHPILIATDDVLSDLKITDVDWLIHYSILLERKTQFDFRFSVLFECLSKEGVSCKVSVFVDERNDVQFRCIVKIMQRMGVVMEAGMLEKIENICEGLERDKKFYPICDYVKSLGICQERSSCPYRHCFLPEIDLPTTKIQENDRVKFLVMYIHDATHFSARVLSRFDPVIQKEVEFPAEDYILVISKVHEYFVRPENRKRCARLEVGLICALEETLDNFKRVQILLLEEETLEKSTLVDVRCIDTGIIHRKIHGYRLLKLPEELSRMPTPIVEVFLTNLAPWDDEEDWNDRSIDSVHCWFREKLDENSYIVGKVELHLGNTVWVNTLESKVNLLGHGELIGSSLRAELLRQGHAVPNPLHVPRIKDLCRNVLHSRLPDM